MSTSSNSNQSQLLSLLSSADISSYYGIAIASAFVAGSALYYYYNNNAESGTIKSKRAPIIDFENQTIVVSQNFFRFSFKIYFCL
jgi:hypothetical protein